MSDLATLVRVSRLYYELGETQEAIAALVGVTRPQVSRLLKEARAQGVVEIRIVDRSGGRVARGRRSASGSGSGPSTSRRASTGRRRDAPARRAPRRAGARSAIRDGMVVGIGDGAGLGGRRRAGAGGSDVDATVVPLCGGFWRPGAGAEPFRRIGEALGATVHALHAPGLLDDAAVRDALCAHPGVRSVLELWERLDVALFGSAARRGARRPSASAAMAEISRRRRGRRGADRPVRDRRPARRRVPAPRGRSRSTRGTCARSRSRSGSPRGPPRSRRSWRAPRRPPERARHRRPDRRGSAESRLRGRGMTACVHDRRAVPRIDLGTTRTKVGLIGRTASRSASGARSHDGRRPGDRARRAGSRRRGGPARRRGPRGDRCRRERRRERDPSPPAVCVVGHGPTLTAVDAAGPPVRPAITWLDTRAGRRAGRARGGDGLRGWALGVLPAALLAGAPRARGRRAHPLVPQLLGGPRAPTLRGRGATLVPGGQRRGRARGAASSGLAVERLAPEVSAGTVLGGLTPTRPRATSGCPPGSRSSPAWSTRSRASTARGCSSRATRSTSAARRVASASTPTRPVEVAGGFTTPAPLPGLYSVGGAMAATGAALDWFATDILGGAPAIDDLIDEAAAIEPGRGWPRLPAVPRRRAVAALGPDGARRLRRADAPARPRPPRPGDPRGRGAGDPARRRADARRRPRGARDARLRRPGPVRRLEPDQGRRHRLQRRGAAGAETAAVGAAIVAAVGIGRPRRPAGGIRDMTAIDRRFEPDPGGPDLRPRLRGVRRAAPGDRAGAPPAGARAASPVGARVTPAQLPHRRRPARAP